MPRLVTRPRVGPQTSFARDALDKLASLRTLPTHPSATLQLPIRFGIPIAARKTPWADLYPSGYVLHCLIHKLGYAWSPKGESMRCQSADCPFPSAEIISTGEVCPIELHHVDLIITDEVDGEALARFHRRIEVHAMTPAFHPNVGAPRRQYCLGYAAATHDVGWFLDQLLAMVGWHQVNEVPIDNRNPEALAYYQRLVRERGSAAIGSFAPIYRGIL